MTRSPTDKRERLVAAAMDCIHLQGYAGTSIADVARVAGVPAGNVFYYFRTKADLARAVVDEWVRSQAEELADLMGDEDGWRRLERFVAQASERCESYVSLGCPLAGLARDLRRESDALRAEIPRVYGVQHAWLRERFAEVGFAPEAAEAHARSLMTGYNGAILMAHAQGDDTLLADGVATLMAWLRQLRQSLAA